MLSRSQHLQTTSASTIKAVFHGVEYVVSWSLSTNDNAGKSQTSDSQGRATAELPVLLIDVEDDNTEQRWHGSFSANYVEEITHKTGNYKRFVVFVKMLVSALTHPSDRLFAELLTLQDLELLRTSLANKDMNAGSNSKEQTHAADKPTSAAATAKSSGSSAHSHHTNSNNNNKRYLIVTYVTEYDRIHYPFPLPLCSSPSPGLLQRTIQRLRGELGGQREPDMRVSRLQTENASLRGTIDQLSMQTSKRQQNGHNNNAIESSEFASSSSTVAISTAGGNKMNISKKKLEQQRNRARKEVQELNRVLEHERGARERERDDWMQQQNTYENEGRASEAAIHRLKQELARSQRGAGGAAERQLRNQVTKLQASLASMRRTLSNEVVKRKTETDRLKADLRRTREDNVDLRKQARLDKGRGRVRTNSTASNTSRTNGLRSQSAVSNRNGAEQGRARNRTISKKPTAEAHYMRNHRQTRHVSASPPPPPPPRGGGFNSNRAGIRSTMGSTNNSRHSSVSSRGSSGRGSVNSTRSDNRDMNRGRSRFRKPDTREARGRDALRVRTSRSTGGGDNIRNGYINGSFDGNRRGARTASRSFSPRFDPTEYKRQQDDKRRIIQERRERAKRNARGGGLSSSQTSLGSARSGQSKVSASSLGSRRSSARTRSTGGRERIPLSSSPLPSPSVRDARGQASGGRLNSRRNTSRDGSQDNARRNRVTSSVPSSSVHSECSAGSRSSQQQTRQHRLGNGASNDRTRVLGRQVQSTQSKSHSQGQQKQKRRGQHWRDLNNGDDDAFDDDEEDRVSTDDNDATPMVELNVDRMHTFSADDTSSVEEEDENNSHEVIVDHMFLETDERAVEDIGRHSPTSHTRVSAGAAAATLALCVDREHMNARKNEVGPAVAATTPLGLDDIDTRLSRLQEFLTAAKSAGRGGGGVESSNIGAF